MMEETNWAPERWMCFIFGEIYKKLFLEGLDPKIQISWKKMIHSYQNLIKLHGYNHTALLKKKFLFIIIIFK